MLSGSPHSPQTYKVVQTNVWHSWGENPFKTSISNLNCVNLFKTIFIYCDWSWRCVSGVFVISLDFVKWQISQFPTSWMKSALCQWIVETR